MNRINLFFNPKSVVLFGANERAGSVTSITAAKLPLSLNILKRVKEETSAWDG